MVIVHQEADKHRDCKTWALRGLLAVAIIALLVTVYHYADRSHFSTLLAWVDENKPRGAFVLAVVQVLSTICLIPTAVLAVAAGALFGFARGLALIWVACVIGETLAFMLGRYMFRAYIERVSASWPTWAAMEDALAQDGWKLVLLLRCCPASPFTLLNYALGSTSLPFLHFFWPSVFGIAPGLAVFVWAGHLIKDISDLGSAEEGALVKAASPAARITFAVVSGVTAVAVLIGSAVYTKRAIARRLARASSGGCTSGGLSPHCDTETGHHSEGARGEHQVLLDRGDGAAAGGSRQDPRMGLRGLVVAQRTNSGSSARGRPLPPFVAHAPPSSPPQKQQGQLQQVQQHAKPLPKQSPLAPSRGMPARSSSYTHLPSA